MTFPHAKSSVRGLTLLIDADDTLWENNIYFDEVVAQYVAFVERHGGRGEDARAKLLEIERERTKRFGYGVDNFRLSLKAACEHLLEGRDYQGEVTASTSCARDCGAARSCCCRASTRRCATSRHAIV